MTMMEWNQGLNGHTVHRRHGWTVSTLCHVLGIGGGLFFMAEIEKPVLPNTFQWEIAMVEAPSPAEPEAAVPPPVPVPQPQPRTERSIKSPPRVETIERSEPVIPDVATPVPVERSVDTRPLVAVETVQQTVHDAETSVERAIIHTAAQTAVSEAVVTQTVTAHPQSMVEQITPTIRTTAVTDPVETVAEQMAVAYAPSVRQADVVEREPPRLNPQASGIEHRVVHHRLVKVRETHADYGWLRDALWSKIQELKRYPAQAKANHWEGRVVVEVVIGEDGTVMNLQVAESSGRAILDQEALAVMRKASPVTLKHPLGKPSLTLLVPISYKLDG